MDGQTDGWTDGRTDDGWMDGWMGSGGNRSSSVIKMYTGFEG